jgi:hypothetical protein
MAGRPGGRRPRSRPRPRQLRPHRSGPSGWPNGLALSHPVFRRILPGAFASALGDGMSAVAIAWLALKLAPVGSRGLLVGAAVAAYSLPGALAQVIAARSSLLILASPLGTALGGPIVAALGARGTLLASALATIALGLMTVAALARARSTASMSETTRKPGPTRKPRTSG